MDRLGVNAVVIFPVVDVGALAEFLRGRELPGFMQG